MSTDDCLRERREAHSAASAAVRAFHQAPTLNTWRRFKAAEAEVSEAEAALWAAVNRGPH